jgi:hypothetical protein
MCVIGCSGECLGPCHTCASAIRGPGGRNRQHARIAIHDVCDLGTVLFRSRSQIREVLADGLEHSPRSMCPSSPGPCSERTDRRATEPETRLGQVLRERPHTGPVKWPTGAALAAASRPNQAFPGIRPGFFPAVGDATMNGGGVCSCHHSRRVHACRNRRVSDNSSGGRRVNQPGDSQNRTDSVVAQMFR